MSNGASNRSFLSDIPEEKWAETFVEGTFDPDERLEQPHECGLCGRKMKYADQTCACSARDPWLR